MSTTKTPNILFLFTDQLRADCIAALGNSKIKTPNIDRLVKEGTTFDRCYTSSPVCAPSRYSLVSGLPPHKTGCVDNVDTKTTQPSFIEHLANNGYQTHGIGKMHFPSSVGDWGFQSRDVSEEMPTSGERDDYRSFLDENGFDHVLDPHGLRSEMYYLPQPSQLPERLHHTHWVADRSIDFLEKRDTEKPFFIWSSFIKPHPPFESPNPWGRLYRMHEMDEPILPEGSPDHWTFWSRIQNRYKYKDAGNYDRHLARSIKAAYYATVSFVDYNIGRILDALGNDIDNTLIVFSSDHGEMLGDFGCYGKRSMLDPSVRVPLIARLPRTLPENYHCGTPTSLLDLFPTFTRLAGAEITPPHNEGISLLDTINGANDDRIVFSQFSQSKYGLYMASNKNWKYIYSAADDKEWLFDLVNDPTELENRIGDPRCSSPYQLLIDACIQRFKNDSYLDPLEKDEWKKLTHSDPLCNGGDDGLLFQDPEELNDQIDHLGPYSRNTDFTKDPRYTMLNRLSDSSERDH